MSKQISCQKAVDCDFDKMRFPLWGLPKVDGQRGNHVVGSLTSRELKPFGNPRVTEKFSAAVYAGFDGEFTVDGRLTGPELCNKTGSVLSTAKLKKGEAELPINVVWNLFDWLHEDIVHLPYGERYQNLEAYVRVHQPAGVHVLPYRLIRDAVEAQAFIEEMLDLEYEGAIFRDPKAMHKSGRATAKANDFWRFKPVSDKAATVLSIEEAMENTNTAGKDELGHTERSSAKAGLVPKGMVGPLICRDALTGETIRVGPGKMTHAERVEWFNDQSQIVGWEIDYRSLDTGVVDAPRQARFVRRKLKAAV